MEKRRKRRRRWYLSLSLSPPSLSLSLSSLSLLSLSLSPHHIFIFVFCLDAVYCEPELSGDLHWMRTAAGTMDVQHCPNEQTGKFTFKTPTLSSTVL